MKVTFKNIIDKPQSLAIVKAIMNFTEQGLKYSKTLYDDFRYHDKETTIEINGDNAVEKAHIFINEVKQYGLECVCGDGKRSEKIKRFYKIQNECPGDEDMEEFLNCNFHITATNKENGFRYMITDFNDFKFYGMKYGEVWKKCLNIEDFHEFEINHISYSKFHLKFYGDC